MDTFKIGRKVVQNLQTGVKNGTISVLDGRGLHDNHTTNPLELTDLINAQLQRFPQYDCHYSRRQHPTHLSPDLNIAKMYRLFCDENQAIEDIENKENLYRRVFRESRMKIGPPLSDTCEKCDALRIRIQSAQNNEERRIATVEKEEHLAKSDLAYQELARDLQRSKLDPTYVVKVCDMQKVLFTPTLNHASMFYKRQLSTYNYCVYNGRDEECNMCVWSETDGNRGVDEVASCLLVTILQDFQQLAEGEERTLIFTSDRCRGQVNNWFIPCILKYLINRRYFTTCEQKFMETGHSFLPCDRMFALIEKQKKTATALVPQEWVQIIRSTRLVQPFRVTEMNRTNIIDIKALEAIIPRPSDLQVTNYLQYRISSDYPERIFAKVDYTPSPWIAFTIRLPNQRGRIINRRTWNDRTLHNYALRRVYQQRIRISYAKYQDLVSMLPFILPQYRPYYENLPHEIPEQ
jgi:hypothetical protein